ncbi:MAG: ferritin [Defluviitaleaceae bacterium]|nr:ferritin [Defluviitaleaceae bacterium]
MLNENITKALNDQVNAEIYSAYLYMSMSAYAERSSLKGAANWLWVQAQEEKAHAIHMYQFILDRGAVPVFPAIDAPDASFSGLKDVFEKVLAHENKVTERINNLATLAMQEHDHACYQFVMWYVNEQVEEEANDTDILGKLEMIGGDKGQLLNLDKELALRTYVNPFPVDGKLNGGALAAP